MDCRIDLGAASNLVYELRLEDVQQLKNIIRMSAVQFERLFDLVKHQIVRQDTKLQKFRHPSIVVHSFRINKFNLI